MPAGRTAFLIEFDMLNKRKADAQGKPPPPVVVVLMTNRLTKIDPAKRRVGRADTAIKFPPPTADGSRAIAEYHAGRARMPIPGLVMERLVRERRANDGAGVPHGARGLYGCARAGVPCGGRAN